MLCFVTKITQLLNNMEFSYVHVFHFFLKLLPR